MKISLDAMTNPVQTIAAKPISLREDFRKELETRLDGWLGKPGTDLRARIEERVSDMLSAPDEKGVRHIDLNKLNVENKTELAKLQKVAQDFEAIFVKGLLSQMRRSSFAEKGGPMADMAKDMMDQAVSESVSRSDASIGIAKTIFFDMGQRVAKTAVSAGRTKTEEK